MWNRAPDATSGPDELVASLPVAPGPHLLVTRLVYQGHGEGVFAYLEGYRFEVRSSHQLAVEAGGTSDKTMTSFEDGGVTMPIERRPAVRWSDARQRSRSPAPRATTRAASSRAEARRSRAAVILSLLCMAGAL